MTSSTTDELVCILHELERDLEQSDQEFSQIFQWAESYFVTGGEELGEGLTETAFQDNYERTLDCPDLQDDLKYSNFFLPPEDQDPTPLDEVVTVPSHLAIEILQVADGPLHICPDGMVQLRVSHVLCALQLLMQERHDYVQEALEMMQISRRTIHMVMTRWKEEETM